MDEELTDYIRAVKNQPEARDEQANAYIGEIKTIHDAQFDNGINGYNTTITVLLLSYFERISYLDQERMSYQTYGRYATFLDENPKRESDYLANAAKDQAEGHKGALGAQNILVNVANAIQNPSFRVYLLLLTISVFKDEGALTKVQRSFVEDLFKKLQIE